MAARQYVVYADWYSGWIEVAHCPKLDAATLKKVMRKWFITFGVPEELSCDGGPQYESKELRGFLNSWGVRVRQSSAYYPQSNGRAEAAVKNSKRLLSTNVTANGSLDSNSAARALLLQRNTPIHGSDLSPSEIVFGRLIRDHLPQVDEIRREWKDINQTREREFARRTLQNSSFYNKSSAREKKPLSVGESVAVQDSIHGKKRWQQTGVVVEGEPSIRQYLVRVDGSNRITRRNQCHLRPISVEGSDIPIPNSNNLPREDEVRTTQEDERTTSEGSVPITVPVNEDSMIPIGDTPGQSQPHRPSDNVAPVRRSERIRKPVVRLDL